MCLALASFTDPFLQWATLSNGRLPKLDRIAFGVMQAVMLNLRLADLDELRLAKATTAGDGLAAHQTPRETRDGQLQRRLLVRQRPDRS